MEYNFPSKDLGQTSRKKILSDFYTEKEKSRVGSFIGGLFLGLLFGALVGSALICSLVMSYLNI